MQIEKADTYRPEFALSFGKVRFENQNGNIATQMLQDVVEMVSNG